MNASKRQKILTTAAVLLTIFFLASGAAIIGTGTAEGWFEWYEVYVLVGPSIVLAGLYLSRRSPVMGGVFVVSGASLMGATYYWFPPYWALAFAVAAIGVIRVRRFA